MMKASQWPESLSRYNQMLWMSTADKEAAYPPE